MGCKEDSVFESLLSVQDLICSFLFCICAVDGQRKGEALAVESVLPYDGETIESSREVHQRVRLFGQCNKIVVGDTAFAGIVEEDRPAFSVESIICPEAIGIRLIICGVEVINGDLDCCSLEMYASWMLLQRSLGLFVTAYQDAVLADEYSEKIN